MAGRPNNLQRPDSSLEWTSSYAARTLFDSRVAIDGPAHFSRDSGQQSDWSGPEPVERTAKGTNTKLRSLESWPGFRLGETSDQMARRTVAAALPVRCKSGVQKRGLPFLLLNFAWTQSRRGRGGGKSVKIEVCEGAVGGGGGCKGEGFEQRQPVDGLRPGFRPC